MKHHLTNFIGALLLLAALAAAGGSGVRAQSAAVAPAAASPEVVVINMDDTVQAVSSEYVTRGIALAERENAAAVVLELNTPGGLDSAMRAIIQAILASPVPVIGYVAPSGARAAIGRVLYSDELRCRGHGARHQHGGGAPGAVGRRAAG